MTTALSVFLAQVKILVAPDDGTVEASDANLNALIKQALAQYSKDTPLEVAEDVTGDGGRYYDIADELASWVEGHSRVIRVEYPAQDIADDELPTYLDDDDWRDDYWSGGTRYLFLPNHTPTASETLRVTYSAPYVFSGSPEATNTPTQDFYAICNLAACLACRAIATKYSRTSSSTINADSVSHTSRASEFARRADKYCEAYSTMLGLIDDGELVPAAGEFLDMDTAPAWPSGRRFLFHGQDTR